MVWFFSGGARPVNPVHRTRLLKQLCWYSRGSGRQTALWGQAGTEEQQDSNEPGHMAGDEFTWKATALAHPRFLPLLLLHSGPQFSL